MSDEELIARLRSACFLAFDDGTNDYSSAPDAADRIEALVKAMDGLQDRLDTANRARSETVALAVRQKARAERLEAALRAVVTAKGLTDPTEHGYEAIVAARTALEGGAA